MPKEQDIITDLPRIGELLLALLLVISCGSFFLLPVYVLDIFSQFHPHYALLGFFSAIYYFTSERLLGCILAGALLGASLLHILPYSVPLERADAFSTDELLRIMSANVLDSNHDYEGLISQVSVVQPDCLIVLEVSPHWADALKQLESNYPHAAYYPRAEDGYGLALFSKKPLEGLYIGPLRENLAPVVVADLRLRQGSVKLIGAHLHNPLTSEGWNSRQSELSMLAYLVRTSSHPVILGGDLNASMWSPAFKQFIADTNLKDPRRGAGMYLSWRGPLPFEILPLDHVLTSPWLRVQSFRTILIRGSDHRAVVADIAT